MRTEISPKLRQVLTHLYQRHTATMQVIASLYEKSITPSEAGGLLFETGARLDQKVSCFLLLVADGNEVIVDIIGRLIEEIKAGERKIKLNVSNAETEVEEEIRESCRCVLKEKLRIADKTCLGSNVPRRPLKAV